MHSELVNMDCMEYMRQFPDKFFDLACVDPPYGIGAGKMTLGKGKRKKYSAGKEWDSSIPDDEYFDELQRVSKEQIIWGGNYFDLPPTKCFLIWDKKNDDRDFAECELAWTSLDSVARMFRMRPQNMDGGKQHPTQKPIQLYRWIFKNYAQPGFKILDTHLGSGSSRIAAHDMKCDFWSCEIDPEYVSTAEKRFNQYASAPMMF
jgi:site-specific DNA-methyltransferase (adenine-specific)